MKIIPAENVLGYMNQMKSYKIYEDQEYSKMIYVEGGSFLLNDKIDCEVNDFWIGQFAVSQELWERVMGNNPSHFKGKNLPVETVSWYDAVEFCNNLSLLIGIEPFYFLDKSNEDSMNKSFIDSYKWKLEINKLSNGYRLPIESEWEYAAKGGIYSTNSNYAGSRDKNKVGWHMENCDRELQYIGLKVPNELGLYDMSGNVSEWCQGWYKEYPINTLKEYSGAEYGEDRSLRGGSWGRESRLCLVNSRYHVSPILSGSSIGLRLARSFESNI